MAEMSARSAAVVLISPERAMNGEGEDGELGRRALGGDDGAWTRLIARHEHRVVVSLLARGVPLERAKELTQETWTRLLERQRAGRLLALELPGLAIVQAAFLASNERRRDGRTEGCDEIEAAVAREQSQEDQIIGRQRLDRCARALAECPEASRRVFEFVYDHPELSYAEAAVHLQLSAQRCKQIVCEVRKRLRASLEQEER